MFVKSCCLKKTDFERVDFKNPHMLNFEEIYLGGAVTDYTLSIPGYQLNSRNWITTFLTKLLKILSRTSDK